MNHRSILLTVGLAAVLCFLPAVGADAQTIFQANLFGQAEIPPVQTDAYGNCTGILDENETVFTLSCEHTVNNPTASHIHAGFSDENGPVTFDLGDASSPIQAEWLLDEEDVIRLLAGGFYVNVHTAANPAGIVRGQLARTQPLEGRFLAVELTGDEVVPPVTTDDSGVCVVGVDFVDTQFTPTQEIDLDVRCAHDVAGADVEIELVAGGAAGEEGTTVTTFDGDSPFNGQVTLEGTAEVNAFLGDEVYLQVVDDSGAVLRGQLDGCLAGPEVLCLNDGRFEVTVDWATTTDSGDGVGVRETDDSGMFWFFRPSNLEVLVKVLDGCGVNGHYWVFSSATTDVGYEIRVTDTEANLTTTYENELGTPAEPILDTAAFEACP